jgi:hypothetical protein
MEFEAGSMKKGMVKVKRLGERRYLQVVLNLVHIVLQQLGREYPSRVEEDTLGLAKGGIGVIKSPEQGCRVRNVDGVRLDLYLSSFAAAAKSRFDGRLLCLQLFGAPRDKHDVVVALGREHCSHCAADARSCAND